MPSSMMGRLARLAALLLLAVGAVQSTERDEDTQVDQATRYIMFLVNPGEGFNLRKDALLRLSASIHELKDKWTLALPPIRWVPHWHDLPNLVPVVTGDRRKDLEKAWADGTIEWVSWSDFINVEALNKYISTVTYDEFLSTNGPKLTTAVHILAAKQVDFSKPLTAHMSDCSQWSAQNANYDVPDFTVAAGGRIFQDSPLYAEKQECMIGPASLKEVRPIIDDRFATEARAVEAKGQTYSLLLSRIEIMMWEFMWSTHGYWNARRHFVFAQQLFDEARRFMKANHIDNGKYMAIHLRRGDFLRARQQSVPQLDEVVAQLKPVMEQRGLRKLFIATDATPEEVGHLRAAFGKDVDLLVFKPSIQHIEPGSRKYHLTDGQVSIIDQILCAHADYFFGSIESFFSITIYEERALLGKPHDTTYNVLCPRNPSDSIRAQGPSGPIMDEFACRPPTRWLADPMPRHYILGPDGQGAAADGAGDQVNANAKDEL